MDINGWMARATLEMLGQAGLGYSFDNFFEDSADEFGEAVKLFLYVAIPQHSSIASRADTCALHNSPVHSQSGVMLTLVVEALSEYLPDSLNRALLHVNPLPQVQRLMRISDTLARRSREIVQEKKVLLEKGDSAIELAVGEGKDIMSLLCECNISPIDA